MFSMLSRLNIGDSDVQRIKPLLSKVKGLNIMIMEKPTFPEHLAAENKVPLQRFEKLNNDVMSAISSLNYEELMTVNSRDSKIKFLSGEAKNGILDNLILHIASQNNVVLMLLDGNISMDDVSTLVEETNAMTALSPIASINSTTNKAQSVRNVGEFRAIEVSTGVKVEFTQSNQQSVVVDVEQEKQQYVITEVEGGVLKIFIRNKGVNNLNIARLVVRVSGPKLNALVTKSGASFKSTNTIVGEAFSLQSSSGSKVDAQVKTNKSASLDLSSGSNIKLSLETKILALDASSGVFVKLKGKTDQITASVSSGSSCDLLDIPADRVTISASSGSYAKINVSEALTASVNSAATVQYKGAPKKLVSDVSKNSAASLISIN